MKNEDMRLLGNHQRCWLWGRNPVQETLRWGRWPILELYLADTLGQDERDEAAKRALVLHIPVIIESKDQMERRCHQKDHQGYLAKMGEYPYASVEEILQSASCPLFAVLDSMQDAFNFGAVCRSAEVFGLSGLFIGETNQAGVSSHVARSSSGAVNRIPVAQVAELPRLLKSMRGLGIQVVGASEKADMPLSDCDFRVPTAMVIGNEGMGIRPENQAQCTRLARIPQQGSIGSLNAAAAASIFFYEALRQRGFTRAR